MDNSILISIIMPTYNRAYIIEKAIKSVVKQTYGNWELLVVDDGSQDNTADVVKSIHDSRIYYIALDSNRGANYARNIGFKVAKGEYISFLDTDNEWKENFLQDRVSVMNASNCDIAFGRNEITTNSMTHIFPAESENNLNNQQFCVRAMFKSNLIDTNAVCIKRKCYLECGGFDENLERFQDWEYFFRIISNPKYKSAFCDNILVKGKLQPNSISNTKSYWRARIQLFEKYISVYREYGALIETAMHILSIASYEYMPDELRKKFFSLMRRDELLDIGVGLCEIVEKKHAEVMLVNEHYNRMHNHAVNLERIIVSKSWRLPDCKFPRGSKLIVYGFGDVGKDYCAEIVRYDEFKLVMAIDREYEKYSDAFVKVGPIEAVENVAFDYIIIAIQNQDIAVEVENELVLKGVPKQKIKWFGLSDGNI